MLLLQCYACMCTTRIDFKFITKTYKNFNRSGRVTLAPLKTINLNLRRVNVQLTQKQLHISTKLTIHVYDTQRILNILLRNTKIKIMVCKCEGQLRVENTIFPLSY